MIANNNALVIFLDDDLAMLDGIRQSLAERKGDWNVLVFTDPLALLDDRQALGCDVLVTDIKISGQSGVELVKKMKARGMKGEIIVLTGTGDLGSAMEAINELGVFRYYTKPCPIERLLDGISLAVGNRRANTDAGDLVPYAIIVIDDQHQLTYMNRAGTKLVSDQSLLVVDAQGRCHGTTPQNTEALYAALQSVVQSGEAAYLGLCGSDGFKRYSILLEKSLRAGTASSVILFVLDPENLRPPSVEALRSIFGLTGSEARLAHQLASGRDLKEASEQLGITVQSTRSYLKVLFEKLGVNRQAELVRMLITAVPPM